MQKFNCCHGSILKHERWLLSNVGESGKRFKNLMYRKLPRLRRHPTTKTDISNKTKLNFFKQ